MAIGPNITKINESKNQENHQIKYREMKRVKRILKSEGEPLSLKEACLKFNESVGIEDCNDSELFLGRLWDLKKKIKVFYQCKDLNDTQKDGQS